MRYLYVFGGAAVFAAVFALTGHAIFNRNIGLFFLLLTFCLSGLLTSASQNRANAAVGKGAMTNPYFPYTFVASVPFLFVYAAPFIF